MKVKYGGFWAGQDTSGFEDGHEYDLTIEQLEELTNRFSVKFNLVKVIDPSKTDKNQHTQYVKYFYLDDQKWSFKQR